MNTRGVRIAVCALVLITISFVSASGAPIKLSIGGVRIYTVWGFLPAPTGGDITISAPTGADQPALPDLLSLGVGGGYEREDVYRDADGADLASISDGSEVTIDRVELLLEPGITWQLHDALPVDLYLGVRSLYRFHRTTADTVFSAGTYFPDAESLFVTTMRTGARINTVRVDLPHHRAEGVDVGAMASWAPPFLGNRISGRADYARFSAGAKGFLPIYDIAPERESGLLSIYAAGQAVFDLLTGNSIPFAVQARTGGYYEDDGLGGIVRGWEGKEMSSLIKLAANLELRIVGPDLGLPTLYPVLTLFLDSGYFAGFRTGGYSLTSLDGEQGFIASGGANLSLQLFGFTYLGYTAAWPLAGTRADGKPVGTEITFGLHF